MNDQYTIDGTIEKDQSTRGAAVTSSILVDVDYAGVSLTPEDADIPLGGTAKDVLVKLQESRNRSAAISDWALTDDPTISISVITTYQDGTTDRTFAAWDDEADREMRASESAAIEKQR